MFCTLTNFFVTEMTNEYSFFLKKPLLFLVPSDELFYCLHLFERELTVIVIR